MTTDEIERKSYIFGYGFFILSIFVGIYILIKMKASLIYWLLLLFVITPVVTYIAYTERKKYLENK